MKLILGKNSSNNMLSVFIKDSTQTYDKGLAGLDYTKVNAYYYKAGEYHDHQISLKNSNLGIWQSGGFVEVNATTMPGLYQLQIPDAVVADDSATLADNSVYLIVKDSGANNVVPCFFEIQLTEHSLDDFATIYDTIDANIVSVNGVAASTVGTVDANLVTVAGDAVTLATELDANITKIDGTNVSNDEAQLGVNVVEWGGCEVQAGSDCLPEVAAVNIVDANLVQINGAAASGVSVIDANVIEVNGATASTATAQLGVNVVSFTNDAITAAAIASDAEINANVTHWTGFDAQAGSDGLPEVNAMNLSDITVTAVANSDVTSINGSAVAAANLQTAFTGGAYNVGGGSIVAASVSGSVNSVTSTVNATLIATALDGITIEAGVTAKQALAVIAAALAGQLSGAATTDVTIKAANNAGTTRIEATVDADGNRSAVTLTLP